MSTSGESKRYTPYSDLRLYPGVHLSDERRRQLDADEVEPDQLTTDAPKEWTATVHRSATVCSLATPRRAPSLKRVEYPFACREEPRTHAAKSGSPSVPKSDAKWPAPLR